ncbi:cystinosin protein, partial [Danaus plexippus plexippus]
MCECEKNMEITDA